MILRRSNYEKMLVLFLALIMLTSIVAGCGSKTEQEPKKEAENATPATENATGEAGSGEVMLYSSLKEDQLAALKEGFTKKYPNIKMDYYAAGTGKVLTKVATEQQSGQIAADLIWVGDPSNYITFKNQGILEPYESPEAAGIDAKFKDPDNLFCGARLIVVGLAYNTNLIDEANAPKGWADLLDDTYKNQMVMSDPAEAGTTMYAVAGLVQKAEEYGWPYFETLAANGMELESGTSSTINKVGASAYKVCIAVDYVTRTLEEQGSPIKFVYPEKDIVAVSSPIGLVKNSPNNENGKLLYDYILSKEGQEILVANQATPIRPDVAVGEGTLNSSEIAQRAMVINDQELVDSKQDLLDKFDALFK